MIQSVTLSNGRQGINSETLSTGDRSTSISPRSLPFMQTSNYSRRSPTKCRSPWIFNTAVFSRWVRHPSMRIAKGPDPKTEVHVASPLRGHSVNFRKLAKRGLPRSARLCQQDWNTSISTQYREGQRFVGPRLSIEGEVKGSRCFLHAALLQEE